MTNVLSPFVSE